MSVSSSGLVKNHWKEINARAIIQGNTVHAYTCLIKLAMPHVCYLGLILIFPSWVWKQLHHSPLIVVLSQPVYKYLKLKKAFKIILGYRCVLHTYNLYVLYLYVLFPAAAFRVYAEWFLWNGFDYFSFICSLRPSVCSTSKLMFDHISYLIGLT